MVNVAISGGSGKVGRTILEVMKGQSRHQAFILSRQPDGIEVGVPSLQVDYNDIQSLTRVLEGSEIHTVISCIGYHGHSLRIAQMNLIKAATASSTTRCFVPSTFGIAYPQESVNELPILADYFSAIEELEKSGMQWTVFLNGCFLDYWAMPHIKSHLRPAPFAIDIAHREAAIPGDGNSRISFTYSFDVARFVVASLDLERWPAESRIAGDILTWNEFVRLAEKTLDCKFKITYDDIEKLKDSHMTELPSQIPCYETFSKPQFQWFIIYAHIPGELNAIFPDIKPITVKDMLETYWKAK
ncbi:NAD(P)-binding protein [Lentithecium fluviatile CBS 122367]|uniref:NAD(P)-binding protein n=1 Tax=Lentithecium fluviatile CBS 122367 TaxID=1168545 RepID=A0A6G1IEH4_9PLEO|nr:NAD(P)-binding protein [Lentithecium fluviatile CBS 122367]